MSKIICDICGTSYPETSARCPICGTTRPDKADMIYDESTEESGIPVSYQYVKGGRFSKANVRKRNNGMVPEEDEAPVQVPEAEEYEEEKGNKGLVITAIILLLAIIAVAAYVAMRLFLPTSTITTPTTAPTTAAAQVLCTAVNITSEEVVTLESVGAQWQIVTSCEPYNTTETVTYASEDESVCTVSPSGMLTAVGAGQTNITVRCGEAVAACSVICTADAETTATEATEAAETPVDTTGFKLSRTDFTLNAAGKFWTIYGSVAGATIAGDKITWTSSNPAVATVENGKVVAVTPGTVRITAKYGDAEQSCIVRCTFKATETATPKPTTTAITEEGG